MGAFTGMADWTWDEAVTVQAGKNGNIRYEVRDTVKAAEILAFHWPVSVERGPKYYRACRACIAVVEKGAAPEKARKAFIAAAEEAEILM